ncbi:MAG: GNAT family N-acetyltransferase [Candidatus Bathyarchaeia archaeon]|jgi:hypothetical protein
MVTVTSIDIAVSVYSPQNKADWDSFVASSKNGVFLFNRDYMEYHSHRFTDHSLMFYHKGKLVAVLPANTEDNILHSHAGLTFGGIISSYNMRTPLMLNIFQALITHCHQVGLKEIIYKPIPYIYHSVPSDEDLYALFVNNAKLLARSVSSCVAFSDAQKFDSNRRDNLRKATRNNLAVKESRDFESFMKIEEETLIERHGVKPVHSVEEIKLLAGRFPENIKLFASFKGDLMLAGILIYESRNVAHVQYAANSKEGWNIGAQDIIEDYLINVYYKKLKRYFDFGISTEKFGRILNVGLIKRKESFGASAVMYDVYHMLV